MASDAVVSSVVSSMTFAPHPPKKKDYSSQRSVAGEGRLVRSEGGAGPPRVRKDPGEKISRAKFTIIHMAWSMINGVACSFRVFSRIFVYTNHESVADYSTQVFIH